MTDTPTPQQDAMAAALRGPEPSATPSTAKEAQARLNHLTTSKDFAERLAKGDVAAVREYRSLTEQVAKGSEPLQFDQVETVDAISQPGALPRAHYEALIGGLRESGFADSAEAYLRDLDSGVRTDRPTSGDATACRQALDALMKDPDFCKGVLAGEHAANRLRTGLAAVIALAADDGQPATEPVLKYLGEFGLR